MKTKERLSKTQKMRRKEAKARREMNKKWERMEIMPKYRHAIIRQSCRDITALIQDECFDGILLQLNPRSESKSYKEQKRLLRRIIEKRQAQAIHRKIGRTNDRFASHMKHHSTSKSANDLHRFQFCA